MPFIYNAEKGRRFGKGKTRHGGNRYYLKEDSSLYTGWLETEGIRYYLNEDGSCSDTPVEINTGKSYVAVTDVDFAGNFVHSTLESVNLSNATTQTYEKNYVEDDAKAGETLGSSTDDLTAAATGSGSAEG